MKLVIRFIKTWRKAHPTIGWYLRALAILVGLYVASYLSLTLQGVYGWGAIGTSGVKWWEWYPKGFGFENETRAAFLRAFYLPIYSFDREYWHTKDGYLNDRSQPVFHGFPP